MKRSQQSLLIPRSHHRHQLGCQQHCVRAAADAGAHDNRQRMRTLCVASQLRHMIWDANIQPSNTSAAAAGACSCPGSLLLLLIRHGLNTAVRCRPSKHCSQTWRDQTLHWHPRMQSSASPAFSAKTLLLMAGRSTGEHPEHRPVAAGWIKMLCCYLIP